MHAAVITTTFTGGIINQEYSENEFCRDVNNQEIKIINLYPEITYQKWEGFGGAITESAGSVLNQMPESLSDQVIRNYFSRDGLNYRFIRTHIDSCDFSLSNYSAVENAEDEELKSFSLEHDEKSIIPWIQKAMAVCRDEMEIMLSPWSPPAFMKSNGQRNGGGKLLKEYYGRWAEYICRYINEYRRRGIPVRMLSIQNEPNAVQGWDSCNFTAQEEKSFLTDFLYPALMRHGLDDIHVYIWDHNKERLFDRALEVIDDDTRSMVYGLAFHWYSGDHFNAVGLVKQVFPEKKLLFSEGCIEYSNASPDDELNHAQHYAYDIIGDMNAGMDTFLDWNIILNENGGPNHAGNFCASPIMYNTAGGSFEKKLSYFYIGHFSRYIKNGALRIAVTQYSSRLEITAFQNCDHSLAVVVLNRNENEETAFLRLHNEIMEITFPQSSISTILINEI